MCVCKRLCDRVLPVTGTGGLESGGSIPLWYRPSTRPGLRAGPSAVSTRIREGERRTLTICRALCARRMKKKAQERRRSMKNTCHKTLLAQRTNLLFRQCSVLAVRCWLCHTGHASSQRIPTTSLRSLNIGAPKARQIARTAWIA